jgi:DNA-binding MarR family transcriptional regulator
MIPALLDDGLGFNLYRAGLLMRRELMRALADHGMTPEQWQVMVTLWEAGNPVSQREIGQMLLKDKPTVSRIIRRLERDGWVKKAGDPQDARVTLIRLTPEGTDLKRVVPRKLFKHFDDIVKDFSEREIEALLRGLKKLRRVLGDA